MKTYRTLPMRLATSALAASIVMTSSVPVYASNIDTSGGSGNVGITLTITPKKMKLDPTSSIVKDTDTLKPVEVEYDGTPHKPYSPDDILDILYPEDNPTTPVNPDDVVIEYSPDGGNTWYDYDDLPGITDADPDNPTPIQIRVTKDFYEELIIDTQVKVNKRAASIKFGESSYKMIKEDWDGASTDLSDIYDSIVLTGFVEVPVVDSDFEVKPDLAVITSPVQSSITYTDGLVITYPKTGSTFNFENYDITTDKADIYFQSEKMAVLEENLSVTAVRKEYDGLEEDGIIVKADTAQAQQYLREATVEYSVDGGAWTTSVPKIKNVGENAVKTRVTISGDTFVCDGGAAKTIGVYAKNLIIVPDDVTIEYGQTAPTEYSYQILKQTDDGNEVSSNVADGETITVNFVNSHQTDTSTGTWPGAITVSGVASVKDGAGTDTTGNYNFTYRTATYKCVNTKYETLKETLEVKPYEGTYDGNSHSAVTVTGDYIEEAVISYSTDGGITWTNTVPAVKDVADSGTIKVRVEMSGQEPLIEDAAVKISQKSVTVAANEAEKEEGSSADLTYTATVTGVVSGQSYEYNIINNKESETSEGSYPDAIVTSDLLVRDSAGHDVTSNYKVTYVAARYVITSGEFKKLQANLTVEGYSKVYDGIEHGLTISGTTENTHLIYSINAGTTWESEAPVVKDVADSTTVYVRAYIGTDTTRFVTKRANLVVTKKPAKITVNAATKTQGEQDPSFSATVEGLVKGESFKYHLERTDDSDSVGTHIIKVVLDEEYPNYQITLKSAYLTIKQAESSKNVKNISVSGYTGYYDGVAHTIDVNIPSGDGVKIEYSTDGGSSWSETKPYATHVSESTTVQVRASDGSTSKTVSTAISIRKAKATITVDDATISLGDDMPDFTATTDGVVGSEQFEYTITAEPVTKAGTYKNRIKLYLTGEYPDYQIMIKNGTLIVTGDNGAYPTVDRYDKDDLIDKRKNIKLISDKHSLITEPEDEIVMIARFEGLPDDGTFLDAETDTLVKDDKADAKDNDKDKNKKKSKAGNAVPFIIGTVVAGAIAVGMGVTGGFSALWLLLLGILFKKKRKHWSGLLTYTGNWATKVKGDTEGVEDMQDLLNKGVTIDELKTLMESSNVETILPANTKMSIDIEGVENEFDADEETFYNELVGKSGHCIVSFYNGAAKLSFVVTMDLH